MSYIDYVKYFYFSGQILHSKCENKLKCLVSLLLHLHSLLTKRYFRFISVDESIFLLLFENTFLNGKFPSQRHSIVLVHSNSFKKQHYKWVSVGLKAINSSTVSSRIVQFIPSTKIPPKFLVCPNYTLYNWKSSLFNCPFTPCKTILLRIGQPIDNFYPPEAKKVVISFFETDNIIIPCGALTKCFINYLNVKRFLSPGDIYCLNSSLYCNENFTCDIVFKVLSITDSSNQEHASGVFIVSENTSVFDQTTTSNFYPPLEWQTVKSEQSLFVYPILPLGLETYYCQLLKWFYPFFLQIINELRPIFILTGSNGVGKSVLLEGVCKKLGVHWIKVDCNNLISNTSTQIKANVTNTIKNAVKCSPCILQLSHADMLGWSGDGHDSDQMIEALSSALELLPPALPLVMVLTCPEPTALHPALYSLALASLHVSPPSQPERVLLLSWLAHLHQLHLPSNLLQYTAEESQSYNLSDLTRLLCLANKERIHTGASCLDKVHIKKILEAEQERPRSGGETGWEDVGGVELLKKEVLNSLRSCRLVGGLQRRGLLLHGPPGTGKTLLARAVASQCGRSFIPVKGPELLNMYVGQSEANLRQVFSRAREAAPCILFFDELDSLAPNRGNKSDSGGVMDRVVSQLLAEMDGLEDNGDVFILAATNRPDLIDPALLRPGRFDKMLYVGPCEDDDSKLKVLNAITRKFLFEENTDLTELLPLLPRKVTGANLYAICSAAWLAAARDVIKSEAASKDTKVVVGMDNFYEAIKTSVRIGP